MRLTRRGAMKLPEAAGLAPRVHRPPHHRRAGPLARLAPKAEQRIYFANHQSHFDWVLIWAALPRDLRAVTRPIAARDYWTATPLQALDHARDLQRGLRQPPARKDGSGDDEDPLEPLMEALRHGDSLVIFPEGTRGHAAEPAPFKSGLYRARRGVPRGPADPGLDRQRAARHAQGRGRAGADPLRRRSSARRSRSQPGEERRAFLDRARAAVMALRDGRLMGRRCASLAASASRSACCSSSCSACSR